MPQFHPLSRFTLPQRQHELAGFSPLSPGHLGRRATEHAARRPFIATPPDNGG
jgi:hypothetical protein